MQLCDFEAGIDKPFFLIAGPCVIESEQLSLDVAGKLQELTSQLSIPFIFKSSFDKANRSSHDSYRGPGIEEGLKILSKVKETIGVSILTDVQKEFWLSAIPQGKFGEIDDISNLVLYLAEEKSKYIKSQIDIFYLF